MPQQMNLHGAKPGWLTFDCYGTLIQWDEGLLSAVEQILARQPHSFLPICPSASSIQGCFQSEKAATALRAISRL